MSTTIDYASVIISITCLLASMTIIAVNFFLEPRDKKIANLKEFLLWAVIAAEKEMGSGTGQLKLRYCYNLCVERFEWLPKLITFDQFSKYVDEALEWARKQLNTNTNIKEYVEGKE